MRMESLKQVYGEPFHHQGNMRSIFRCNDPELVRLGGEEEGMAFMRKVPKTQEFSSRRPITGAHQEAS